MPSVKPLLALSLALAFALELVTLIALGLWGAQLGQDTALRILFSGGAPLLTAILWGTLLSPKAPVSLPPLLQLALKLVVFALGTGALFAVGHPILGTVFGVLAASLTIGLYSQPA